MPNDEKLNIPGVPAAPDDSSDPAPLEHSKGGFARTWESLAAVGLGGAALRVATSVISISLFLIVVWVMGSFYLGARAPAATDEAVVAAPLPTATVALTAPVFELPAFEASFTLGITRLAMLHTTIQAKPRNEVTKYTVLEGDTLFGIAEKFGLKPGTLLGGNRYILGDDPHTLRVGMELNILPLDGVYHKWSAGEGLNGVAHFYQVEPEDIINYPGNNLSLEAVGDFTNPNIEPDTWLIVPGGLVPFTDWKTPLIPRGNPASALNLGPGACQGVLTGLVGNSTFLWPTTWRFLSGWDFDPSINHPGIDIAGDFGNPVFASDTGVIVFAGMSAWGYGNEIVIDHGNGWQTLYAHLTEIYVGCGMSVLQGATIGTVGSTGNSTGPHLHFELRHEVYGKVNPWDFLQ
jgi:hypothetical protein